MATSGRKTHIVAIGSRPTRKPRAFDRCSVRLYQLTVAPEIFWPSDGRFCLASAIGVRETRMRGVHAVQGARRHAQPYRWYDGWQRVAYAAQNRVACSSENEVQVYGK